MGICCVEQRGQHEFQDNQHLELNKHTSKNNESAILETKAYGLFVGTISNEVKITEIELGQTSSQTQLTKIEKVSNNGSGAVGNASLQIKAGTHLPLNNEESRIMQQPQSINILLIPKYPKKAQPIKDNNFPISATDSRIFEEQQNLMVGEAAEGQLGSATWKKIAPVSANNELNKCQKNAKSEIIQEYGNLKVQMQKKHQMTYISDVIY